MLMPLHINRFSLVRGVHVYYKNVVVDSQVWNPRFPTNEDGMVSNPSTLQIFNPNDVNSKLNCREGLTICTKEFFSCRQERFRIMSFFFFSPFILARRKISQAQSFCTVMVVPVQITLDFVLNQGRYANPYMGFPLPNCHCFLFWKKTGCNLQINLSILYILYHLYNC